MAMHCKSIRSLSFPWCLAPVGNHFDQIQRISVTGLNRGPEVQVIEALALPEGDPVYEVSLRGWGWQREVQQITAVSAPAPNETEIQVHVTVRSVTQVGVMVHSQSESKRLTRNESFSDLVDFIVL